MLSPNIIGIDPGIGGAISFIVCGSPSVFDTPTFLVQGKKNKRHFDIPAMKKLIEFLEGGEGTRAFIEAVSAMPGGGVRTMGATSAFSFGRGVGIWEGLLVGLGIPYTRVQPQRWKKVMMDGEPKDKGASILVAKRFFPGVELNRKKDHGRADALLIAEYGRRSLTTA